MEDTVQRAKAQQAGEQQWHTQPGPRADRGVAHCQVDEGDTERDARKAVQGSKIGFHSGPFTGVIPRVRL